jgi:hypothetical protein
MLDLFPKCHLIEIPFFILDQFKGMMAKVVSTSKLVEFSPLKTQPKCSIHESMDIMHLKHSHPNETKPQIKY